MARTRLFYHVKKALSLAVHNVEAEESKQVISGITRREFAGMMLAGAAVAGSGGWNKAFAATAGNAPSGTPQRICIVGGGVAGLTAAYRLVQAGIRPILCEASVRTGGRIQTQRNFNADGMFCEMGGEFVDTGHASLRELCKELSLSVTPLNDVRRGEELYYFGGKYFTPNDLIAHASSDSSPKSKKGGQSAKSSAGAFIPLARRISEDARGLKTSKGWSDKARRLDAISLHDYLEKSRGQVEDWVLNLVGVAYTTEYGLDTKEQSALNLISLIGTDAKEPFSIYGESDEAWRIGGGSSSLVEALMRAIDSKSEIRMGHQLVALAKSEEKIVCKFKIRGETRMQTYDKVILALPFTMLRAVSGLPELGFSESKLKAINELGYGTNAKIIYGTRKRVWEEGKDLPVSSNGSFFTDLSLQSTWDSSRGQRGDSGIIVNYLGGAEGAKAPLERLPQTQDDLLKLIPGLDKVVLPKQTAMVFWKDNEFVKGSYTCPKPGQVTTLLEAAARDEAEGRILFAGEHTSVEYNGFMNGAVESGERAAKTLLETIAKERKSGSKKPGGKDTSPKKAPLKKKAA